MLYSIQIENFAIIKKEVINFTEGFNVLLGETGAGKSIVLKALDFVLGGKSDKSNIRREETYLRVSAQLFSANTEIKNYFQSHLFDFDGNIDINRVLHSNGRVEQKINGNIVSASELKELGEILVTTFTQHEGVALLDEKKHITYLDDFCGERIISLRKDLTHLLEQLKDVRTRISLCGGDEKAREDTLSLLRYQIGEINDACLIPNEDEKIKERLSMFSASEKINEAINQTLNIMNNGLINSVQESSKLLGGIEKYSEALLQLSKRVESSKYELMDISNTLSDISNDFIVDNMEFNRLDERYDLIKTLKKKYGATIDDVLKYSEDAEKKVADIENLQAELEELLKQKNMLECKVFDICLNLSKIRRSQSDEFVLRLQKELDALNMKSTTLSIKFDPIPESYAEATINNLGFDKVEFLFSANVGSKLKQLTKTISGGELSRLMLALKSILKTGDESIFIFDEIDAGISGKTGINIAEKLANISTSNQVICISHLPQVCSMADNFIYIEKRILDNQTISSAQNLQIDKVPSKLSTLAGGKENEYSLEFVKDLLSNAKTYKATLHKND